MRMTVLCINNFPIGVYTAPELADQATTADWMRREPRNRGLNRGETRVTIGGIPHIHHQWHYHVHEFEVDAGAKL